MAADNFWTWAVWGPILVTLLSGTVSSLANKVVYDTPIDGTEACGRSKFQKAYFFTLCMFIGEALCLVVYYIKQFVQKRSAEGSYQTLAGSKDGARLSPQLHGLNQSLVMGSGSQRKESVAFETQASNGSPDAPLTEPVSTKKPPIWVYAVLCLFDLSATSVGGVGLIWVDASTNQMLRGSMVVFCAIFSRWMLKRKLTNMQWSCIGLVCVGLALVGMSGLLKQHYDPSTSDDSSSVSGGQLLIGILLVLLASALNAVQNVFEEKLLKAVGGAEVDPLELVGWEGTFGTLLSAFVLLPIVYQIPGPDCGKAEDSLNTLKQLQNSPMAVGLSLSFVFGLMLMNWTSQQISQQLSAVHRNLVSAVRTVLVWVGSIILYYTTKDDSTVYGEQWTNWSLLELAGFIVLVAGTVLYSYAGILASKAQAEDELLKGEFSKSPDYVVPISTMGEHQQTLKQQAYHDKTSGLRGNGHGIGNGNGNGNGHGNGVYDHE